MAWPAAGEVGPAPFSQPRAAPPAQPGVKLQLQPQAAARLSASASRGHVSPRRRDGRRFNALRAARGCQVPVLAGEIQGEFRALPFGERVIFVITNPVMQKEKLFSKQKGHISRVVQP